MVAGASGASLWNLTDRTEVKLVGHGDLHRRSMDNPGVVGGARFTGDGRRIVTIGFDGTVRLWDLSGQPVRIHEAHERWAVDAAVLADGSVASASFDGTARLWTASGEAKAVWDCGSPIFAIAAAPDGRTLVTGSADGRLRFWSNDFDQLAELADQRLQLEQRTR